MKPRILIGMWPLSGDFGPVSLITVEKVIQKAIDNGFCEFDVFFGEPGLNSDFTI